MIDKSLYRTFVEHLRRRISHRSDLVNDLVELLNIEKEAVYRRMRGEVAFTFSEVAKIARHFAVSIDEVIDISASGESNFHLSVPESNNEKERDLTVIAKFMEILGAVHDDPNSLGVEATNILPQPIYLLYESLTRYYLMKWKHQRGISPNRAVTFSEIKISEQSAEAHRRNVSLTRELSHTTFILDHALFQYIVNDVVYFRSLNLMAEEEAAHIRTDLMAVLDLIESLCETGRYPDTGKRVEFFISDVNLDTNYGYTQSTKLRIAHVKTFIMNAVVSGNKSAFDLIRQWIDSIKRQSVLITESGERERILFLREQRRIVSSI